MLDVMLFAFAKEFGWGYDYLMNMPFRLFRVYARELGEHYKAQEAASQGKKYKRMSSGKLSDAEKARRKAIIEQMEKE